MDGYGWVEVGLGVLVPIGSYGWLWLGEGGGFNNFIVSAMRNPTGSIRLVTLLEKL